MSKSLHLKTETSRLFSFLRLEIQIGLMISIMPRKLQDRKH